MGCNPCCCWNVKDGAITIGIWAAVFSVAQLSIMGWQMAAIKYEKDRADNTLLPNYNTYGRFDIPSYYESYWQSPESRYYTGLFVIQVLCLISAFFLLFASVAMIYGVHTWSRYLVWPWFPCMVSSILSSLAYCVMWWAGDVRDYWLALTIIEIIGVFVNIYCVVVVAMFYRRLQEETDYYEGKDKAAVKYRAYRSGHSSRRDLLEDGLAPGTNNGTIYDHQTFYPPGPSYPQKTSPYPTYPAAAPYPQQPYPAAYPQPTPYGPLSMPSPPYPFDVRYDKEPRPAALATGPQLGQGAGYDSGADDMVSSWVKDQQRRGLIEQANSEPTSPTKQPEPFGGALKHSRSVPSVQVESLGDLPCRHHRTRSRASSRHRDRDYDDSRAGDRRRSRSRDRDRSRRRHASKHRSSSPIRHYESDSSTQYTESTHHTTRHRSRDKYSDTEYSDASRRHRHHRHRDDKDRKHRHRDKADRKGPRQVKRDDRERDSRESEQPLEEADQLPFGPNQGISIPQHIFIPPNQNPPPVDAAGNVQPQKYQINSEIVISYDPRRDQATSSARPPSGSIGRGAQPGLGPAPVPQPPPRPAYDRSGSVRDSQRRQPVSITSNV